MYELVISKEFKKELEDSENKLIKESLDINLDSTQVSKICEDSVLADIYKQMEAEKKDNTLYQWQNYLCARYLNNPETEISIEKGLDNFNDQNSAILLLGLVPTFAQQIQSINGVHNCLSWLAYVNTNERHVHSKDIDDILVKSTDIVLNQIGSGFLKKYKSEKAIEDLNKILNIASKNTSQNFLETIKEILQKINEAKSLSKEEKEELFSHSLKYLRDSVNYAQKTNIYSSFILGKEDVFTIIRAIGEDLNDFEQSDLSTIIDNLFSIYFFTMNNFGQALSEDDKRVIFASLIPYADINKKELILNKLSESIDKKDNDWISLNFAYDILGKILIENKSSNWANTITKKKCSSIITDLFINGSDKKSDLKDYISASLDDANQSIEVNKELLKKLLNSCNRNNLENEKQEEIYDILIKEFEKEIDMNKYPELFANFIDEILLYPDKNESKAVISKLLRSSRDKKDEFLKLINRDFDNYVETVQEFILSEIFDWASEITDPQEKLPFLECLGLIKNVTSRKNEESKHFRTRAEETLIDILSCTEKKQSEISQLLIELFRDKNTEEKKDFLILLWKRFVSSEYEVKLYQLIKDVCSIVSEEELTNSFFETITDSISSELSQYETDKTYIIQIGSEKSIDTLYKWARIILNSENDKYQNECKDIIEILNNIILHGDATLEQRKKCYELIKESYYFKNNRKEFIKYSLSLLDTLLSK